MDKKIFWTIIAAVIIARLFIAITLPDTAYTDALYHSAISEHLIETGNFPFEGIPEQGVNELPPAFMHAWISGIFILSGNAFSLELSLIFPVIIALLQLSLLFLVLQKFFRQKYFIIAFLFSAFQPVLMLYSSTNYPEAIGSVLVLFSFYLLLRYNETKNPAFIYILPFSLGAMALSKLTATTLLPVFLLALLYYPLKHGLDKKKILAVFLLAFFLSGFWFACEFQRTGSFFSSNASEIDTIISSDSKLGGIAETIIGFNHGYWFFLGSALQEQIPFFSSIPLETISLAFFALSFPLLLVSLFGLIKFLKNREKYSFFIFLVLIFGSLAFAARAFATGRFYIRLLLPILPFCGIFFAYGLKTLKIKWLKRIALVLFAIILFYSLSFGILTSMHYHKIFAESKPMYEFAKTLSKESVMLVQRHQTRPLTLYSGIQAERDWDSYAGMNSQEFYSELENLGITHIGLNCHKQWWNSKAIEELESQGKITNVFSNSCIAVFEKN